MNIQIADASKAQPEVMAAAKYLRNTTASGLKLRPGVFNGKRVEYFKARVLSARFKKMLTLSTRQRTASPSAAAKRPQPC